MAGDTIDIDVYASYIGPPVSSGAINNTSFATLIGAAFGGNATGSTFEQSLQTGFEGHLSAVVPSTGSNTDYTVKAYLNYVLFDQDFNLENSGYVRVDQVNDDANNYRHLVINNILVDKPGYLFVYTSNEGNVDFNVFFDELRIVHTPSAILQEDHYYPFGMSISALSSSAPLSKPNDFKYNGFEEEAGFNLGWYDYSARLYDPQLGVFTSVDPAADLMRRHSPYSYAFDNPIRYIDPDGMMPSMANQGSFSHQTYSAIDLSLIHI